MIAVDEHTGSNPPLIQNTSSPNRQTTSLEPFRDPSQSSQWLDSTALASHTSSIACFSTAATASESDPPSKHALRDYGAGVLLSKELPMKISPSTSWSSTLKALEHLIRIKLMTLRSSP